MDRRPSRLAITRHTSCIHLLQHDPGHAPWSTKTALPGNMLPPAKAAKAAGGQNTRPLSPHRPAGQFLASSVGREASAQHAAACCAVPGFSLRPRSGATSPSRSPPPHRRPAHAHSLCHNKMARPWCSKHAAAVQAGPNMLYSRHPFPPTLPFAPSAVPRCSQRPGAQTRPAAADHPCAQCTAAASRCSTH